MIYHGQPETLDILECHVQEYFSYTYLPIKLVGSAEVRYEKRLTCVAPLIGRACCHFIGRYGLDRYVESYVYVTAKHQYQRANQGFNRPGWHSDGFGTDDISYIWSNRQPTVFSNQAFDISPDDVRSMQEMERQAIPEFMYTLPNHALVHLDQSVIHKVGVYEEGNRAFVKICISRDKYDLAGNSINYELDYQWEYRERRKDRNVPQIPPENFIAKP